MSLEQRLTLQIAAVKDDVKAEIAAVKTDVAAVKADVATVKTKMDTLEGKIVTGVSTVTGVIALLGVLYRIFNN